MMYAGTELSDFGRDLLRDRLGEAQAKTRGYSFARAGKLWIPKRRKLECWGAGFAGTWATRSMNAPRDTPLTLPGSANLESWHYAGQGLTLGATLKRSGTAAPADMTISAGSRAQSIGLKITTSAGALGVATYSAYIDGGGSPIQTGTTGASVVLSPIGLTIAMPAGTYSADNVYEGVVESWANLTTKTRTLSSVGAVSAQPTLLWQDQNARATIHSDGGSTGYLRDVTSDWASLVASGDDATFDVFMVAKTDSATPTSFRSWFAFGNAADADSLWTIGIRNGTNDYRSTKTDDAGTGVNADGGAINTSYHVIRVTQHGTTIDLRVDGTAVYTGTSQNVGVTTLTDVCVFAMLRAGAASNAMVGAMGELITYNTDLSAGDGLVVENYLRDRWAL